MKYLVIIPTYNESENIKQIIFDVLKQNENLEMLIIDDNSPDNTYKIVEEIINNTETQNRVNLIKRHEKLGLGSAYVTGFKYAIENNYDYVLQMDADFSHDPADIPFLIEEIQNYHLVIGSRYIIGLNVVNWPLSRLILSYFASKYVQFITWMPIKDPTGGFKCIRVSTLKSINLEKILSDGYSFQIEINYRIWLKKFKIKEIPIVFTDRRVGQSKMSKKIVREAIWMVWKLRLYSLFNKL